MLFLYGPIRWFPLRGSKGNAVRAETPNAVAAPATVSGELTATLDHWGNLGRSAAGDDP